MYKSYFYLELYDLFSDQVYDRDSLYDDPIVYTDDNGIERKITKKQVKQEVAEYAKTHHANFALDETTVDLF